MTKVLVNNFEYVMRMRNRIMWTLSAIVICLAAIYGFYMEKTISNTAALSAIQSTLARESESVSELSGQYVALSKGVTLDSALAQGFVEAPVSAFITVPAPLAAAPALSINISPSAY